MNNTSHELSIVDYISVILILAGAVLALVYLLPTAIVLLGAVIVGVSAAVYAFVFGVLRYDQYVPNWLLKIPIWVMLLVPGVVALYFIFLFEVRFSVVDGLIFFALLLLISVYWLVVPAALNHYFTESNRTIEVDEWPSITVLIPAYNESGYVGPCIDSFLDADYPADILEIIVIDDGSQDDTFDEAELRANDAVTVLQQENSGKYAALNNALEHATTELIIGVDADSRIASDALKELVRTLTAKPEAAAVAGNVKVANRDSFITNVQALEYIVSINMFRRALDQLGLVKVVPGCLGLFRREAVDAVGGYSGDTVTEDFDLTLTLLKQDWKVHFSSTAIVRTEAPDTWGDLYNQRRRWFRGTVQAALKHRDIFYKPEFGSLHRVLAPFMILSVVLVPLLGMVVLGTILWMAIFGSIVQLLGIIVIFVLLEMLFATIALRIEDTVEDESLWLVRFAPLMVIGYKQFQDLIMLRSLFETSFGADTDWRHTERIRQRDQPVKRND